MDDKVVMALDTETTGLDVYHGCRPYLVTTCTSAGRLRWWLWDVDPETRRVAIPQEDVVAISQAIGEADVLVTHNGKFDHAALREADPRLVEHWDWSKVWDTVCAGHLLASNQPHNLTDMAHHWLGRMGAKMEPLEERLEEHTKAARNLVRRRLPHWRIADEDDDDMPSTKKKSWKADMWLPRAVCMEADRLLARLRGRAVLLSKHQEWVVDHAKPGHPWRTSVIEYANADSQATVMLYDRLRPEIKKQDLEGHMQVKLEQLRITSDMERDGVTACLDRIDALHADYTEEARERVRTCEGIAAGMGHRLSMSSGARTARLSAFMFRKDGLALPVVGLTDSRKPSMTKDDIAEWLKVLPENSKQLAFVRALSRKRKLDKVLDALVAYRRFGRPLMNCTGPVPGHILIHPNFNVTGTDTTRMSSSNPNAQNVEKEVENGDGPRFCFGPAPGEEMWAIDYFNLELVIPAYEAGEESMISLFERPDDPPYYGSNHLLVLHAIFPEVWDKVLAQVGPEKVGAYIKEHHNPLYKRIKNGNFAKQYGAQRRKTDATFGRVGAYDMLNGRFPRIAELTQRQIAFARRHGYVETMPDRTVNPRRGYPLLCSRTDKGDISPTVPLSYHVQGTAGWACIKGMVRCAPQLREWRRDGFNGRLVLNVHDELDFLFPRGACPLRDKEMEKAARRRHPDIPAGEYTSNLWRVRRLQALMAMSGDDIGVPLRTSATYHPENWQRGTEL